MLNKISGLARSLYIVLAIAAGFIAMGGLNVALVLVVLGLIAGISMPRDRMVLAAAAVIALPIVGTALANIPAVGAQLSAVMTNLQLGIAGALASAFAIFLYELTMDGVTGLTATSK
jgi:hypothetical protein